MPSRPLFRGPTKLLDRAMLAAHFGAVMGSQARPVNASALVDTALAAPLRAGVKALKSELALGSSNHEEALALAEKAINLDPPSRHTELLRDKALKVLSQD